MKHMFRTGIATLCAALLLGALPLPALAADAGAPDAQIDAAQVHITLNDGQTGAALLDANRGTSLDFTSGVAMTIASDAPFDSLYLVWDHPPAPYPIDAGGAQLVGGEGGYLHEYVPLPSAVDSVDIQLPAGDYLLCDVYLFSGDALPDFVQVWQPPLEKADLLALPTHADDEHLFFGGVLPTYAGERGLDVQVVYMTNHFGEPYRPHELLNGLWKVGVTAYPVMGPFPDEYASLASLESAEQCFGRENVLAFQVDTLRRFKPSVVVAHDIDGEYGHGAHILNAQTLLEALEKSGDAAAYPDSAARYGTWEVPKAYLHLWAENGIAMDWDVPLSAFGGRTAFEMAVEGFAEHASQQDYFAVEQWGDYDCRLFGLAHTTVGPDALKNDLFENIDLNPEPVVSSAPEETSAPQPAQSGPDTPASQADAPAKKGLPTAALVAILVVVAVAIVIVCLLLVAESRRRKRRRRRQRQAQAARNRNAPRPQSGRQQQPPQAGQDPRNTYYRKR